MPIQFVATSPLTVEEAKGHLRVDGSLEDSDIELKLKAAVEAVSSFIGPLVETACVYSVERFEPGHSLYLPARRISQVSGVTYFLDSGPVTLAPSAYRLDSFGVGQFPGHPRLVPVTAWPTEALRVGVGVSVEFTAGWPVADVPGAIKSAVLLEMGNLYRNRESIVMEGQVPRELDRGVRHLLMPFKLEFQGWLDERRTA